MGSLPRIVLSFLCALALLVGATDAARATDDEVEVTAFDILVDGTLSATGLARYGDGWVELEDPLDVVDQLGLETHREKMVKALEGRINRERKVEGVLAIKVDTDYFRLSIVFDPSLQSNAASQLQIPPPDDRASAAQRVGIIASGDYSGEDRSAISYQTRISKGQWWGHFDGASPSDGESQLDEAGIRGVVKSSELGAGLFRTPGLAFAQSLNFAGLSWRSAEELLQDSESLRGSRFQVFIPGRARVEFYRDTRLLSVQELDFGLQEIDTRSWPQGSYEVQVLIKQDTGETTSDRRFFTKSGLLALSNVPQFALQLGTYRDVYDIDERPLYQFSGRSRVAEGVELNGGIYGDDRDHLLSLGSVAVWRDLTTDLDLVFSEHGELGASSAFFGEWLSLGWNFQWARSFSDEDPPTVDYLEDEGVLVPVPARDELSLLSARRETIAATVSKDLGSIVLRLNANRNDASYQSERHAYGPSAEWRIISSAELSVSLHASHFETEEGGRSQMYLGIRKTFSPWTAQSQLSARQSSGDGSLKATTQLVYDKRTFSGRGVRATFQNESGNEADGGDQGVTTSNGAAIEYGSDATAAGAFLRDLRGSRNDGTSYGLNVHTAAGISADGVVSITRPVSYDSTFIAEIHSSSTKSSFELLVNDQVYDVVKPGERATLGLTPFRTYRFSIRPTNDGDVVDYDTSVRTFTLYPGNVVRSIWKAEKVFIALGRLIDDSGEPIAYERIRGAKGFVYTEADGSFQAEVSGTEPLVIESSRRRCSIELPDVPRGEHFTDYGDVRCRAP